MASDGEFNHIEDPDCWDSDGEEEGEDDDEGYESMSETEAGGSV